MDPENQSSFDEQVNKVFVENSIPEKHDFPYNLMQGRINRKSYFLISSIVLVFLFLILYIAFIYQLLLLFFITLPVVWILEYIFAVKRMHDFNVSGKGILRLFLINGFMLLLKQGDSSLNNFGDPPPSGFKLF